MAASSTTPCTPAWTMPRGLHAIGVGVQVPRTPMACNPRGIVQAGVHGVVLDAAMNFAINAGLDGRDVARATLEMKVETMRAASAAEALSIRGAVVRAARQVAYAEATVVDGDGRIVSRSTGTFLLQRASEA